MNGIFTQRHAIAASEYADIVILYAASDSTLKSNFYYKEEKQLSDKVREVIYYYKKEFTGIKLFDVPFKLFLYFLCMYKGYKDICKERQPDLCHVSVMKRTVIFAWFLKKIFGIKFVYTEHWGGYHPADGNYTGLKKILYPLFISKAEWIMPVTQNLINVMKENHIHGRYTQISNVADTHLFRIKENVVKNEKITAIHISNFDNHSKNITGLIEVIKLVSQKRNDFKLNFVGHGDGDEYFKQLARQNDLLDKSIFFLGPKYGSELYEELSNSDFLVIFSNYENQPCVIAEAMACGKPILATTVGGIPEMVSEETGILSPPKDIQKMADNFYLMLEGYKKYDKYKIRAIAEDNYSYSKVGFKFYEVYMNCLIPIKTNA
ncbi:MAG: glycosyltransferase family 4 protein [Opitutaceae bacterium]|nr:glycosyltransferase family 4 protein [Cytophagales bacterium]